jgi:hypothetical protein
VGSGAEGGQPATFHIAFTRDRGRGWHEVLTDRARSANNPITRLQCVANSCAYLENTHNVFISRDGGRTWRDRVT